MAADFTLGPWHISKGWNYVRYTLTDGTCPNVCSLVPFGGPPVEANANARLIAAAPTGYQLIREALQALTADDEADLETWVDLKDWIKAARAYLRAVEGEP